MVRAVIEIIKILVRFRIAFALEHPENSYMWHIEFFKLLAADSDFRMVTVDQCAFGAPWRKRTKFLLFLVDGNDADALAKMRCCGRTVCSFSGKKHVQIIGSRLSTQASAYPQGLSRTLARMLLHQVLCNRWV